MTPAREPQGAMTDAQVVSRLDVVEQLLWGNVGALTIENVRMLLRRLVILKAQVAELQAALAAERVAKERAEAERDAAVGNVDDCCSGHVAKALFIARRDFDREHAPTPALRPGSRAEVLDAIHTFQHGADDENDARDGITLAATSAPTEPKVRLWETVKPWYPEDDPLPHPVDTPAPSPLAHGCGCRRRLEVEAEKLRDLKSSTMGWSGRAGDPLLKHGPNALSFAADTLLRVSEMLPRGSDRLPCGRCGGPHPFDTSINNAAWNRVIRGGDGEGARGSEYLCATCIITAFVRTGEGFTAELWGELFNGETITVALDLPASPQPAEVAGLREENERLRKALRPFAEVAPHVTHPCGASSNVVVIRQALPGERPWLTFGDFRRAESAALDGARAADK
jgi:hypothetical protein